MIKKIITKITWGFWYQMIPLTQLNPLCTRLFHLTQFLLDILFYFFNVKRELYFLQILIFFNIKIKKMVKTIKKIRKLTKKVAAIQYLMSTGKEMERLPQF